MTTRAALYARRSREEHQYSSTDVQVEQGLAFIAERGWETDPSLLFVEREKEASRAEFKKRRDLIAMLDAAKRGEFRVLVIRDESRLGGDMLRVGLLLEDLRAAGVRVFHYFTGEEVVFDNATAKLIVTIKNYSSELEREKVSQRTHEHLLTKARAGRVVGGRVYGYENVPVMAGERRAWVEYRIDEEQAAVVREIYQRRAEGEGQGQIVKDLNARGVASPRAGGRGTGTWSKAAVNTIVKNERYLGRLVWNRENEGIYRGGTKVREARPESEWVIVEKPELRIVDDDLWHRANVRFRTKQRFGRKRGCGAKPKYLLSGFARCGICGGPITVANGKAGTVHVKVYTCAYHRDRGAAVCSSTLRRPVDAVDQQVIGWLQQNVLSERVIVAALRELRARLKAPATKDDAEVPQLKKRTAELRKELDRLGQSLLATEAKPATIVRMIAEREEQLRSIEARITALKTAPEVLDLETRRLEKEARTRLADLNGLLRRNPTEARAAMEALLAGPLVFTPTTTAEGKRYRIEGHAALDYVFPMRGVPSGTVIIGSRAGGAALAAIPILLAA